MAIYHCSIKIGSRSKGQSAIASSAYRSGQRLTDKETGLISDYTKKGGVVFSEIILCDNAPAEYNDRETLWNAVHSIEKNKNAQLWREFEVALPKEFNRTEQIETVREFVNNLKKQGMCIDWSLHDKGDGNPHAHIMTTMRSIEPNGNWSPKSRKVYDLDKNGNRIFQKLDKSGRKQYKSHKEDYNDWNAKERVEEWRSDWARCCNKKLELNKHIDHRSYVRQDIAKVSTVHEGYKARKRVANGLESERVQLNLDIRQSNKQLNRIAQTLKTVRAERTKVLVELRKPPCIPADISQSERLLMEKKNEIEKLRGNIKVFLKMYACANIIYGGQKSTDKDYNIARQVMKLHPEITTKNYMQMSNTIEIEKKKLQDMVQGLQDYEKSIQPKKLSDEELKQLTKLKDSYIYHYCANEYLKNRQGVCHKAQKEYDEARVLTERYGKCISKYCDIENKIQNTLNPIKKHSLKNELAEQGEEACLLARKVCVRFKTTSYYNGREISENNVTSEHLYAIKRYTRCSMEKLEENMEKEKKANEIYQKLNSMNISDKSVKYTYDKLVSAIEVVPDEQCERALKAVKEPTPYFSFETEGYNSPHRLKALENVEKALSKLYKAFKRLKASLSEPLFSKKKIMSDEFNPTSKRDESDYPKRSYDSRSR